MRGCRCVRHKHFLHTTCLTQIVVNKGTNLCAGIEGQDIQLQYTNDAKTIFNYLLENSIFWSLLNGALLILNLIWSLRQLYVIEYKKLYRSGDNRQLAQNLGTPIISMICVLFAFRRIYNEFINWRNICLVLNFKDSRNSQ